MELTTEVKTLLDGLRQNFTDTKAAYEQMKSEITTLGSASTETKSAIDRLLVAEQKMRDDLKELAQKVNGNAYNDGARTVKTAGEIFTESAEFKSMGGKTHRSGLVSVKRFFGSKDITGNASDGMTDGLPQNRRIDMFADPKQELRIRDLLPVTPLTGATSVEYVKYTFTNNAAIIYDSSPSPNGRRENILKPLSDMDMTIANETAETIAHLVYASKQILNDIPQLRSIINTELIYGLKFVEEDEILNGDGTAGHLNGLVTQATGYNTGLDVSGDTMIDKIRRAILQARLAHYPVDGIVLSPTDWATIETTKDGNERYLIGDPRGMIGPGLWGKRIVESDSMADDHFLVGAFGMGARLYDLEQANVESTDSHEDFFRRNMIAIRAEERILLVVTRPQAFVYGAF